MHLKSKRTRRGHRTNAGDVRVGIWSLLLASLLALSNTSSAAGDEARSKSRYFYFGYSYGSQSLFNPLTVVLNRGFDVLQVRTQNRNIFDRDYEVDARNVFQNVIDPFSAIATEGTWKFTREELLPLSYSFQTARWAPNYTLHLIGGGVTYTMLREWYEDHAVPAPAIFSMATVFLSAFINETVENLGVAGLNTDAIADLYIFDTAGILLFSIEPVNRFFSRNLIISNWSLQPMFTLPKGDLHNAGDYYAIKWPLPFYERLRLFAYTGFSSLGGLSYKITGEHSISVAAGGKIATLDKVSNTDVHNVVTSTPSAAIFFDRNNSLLASIQVSDIRDYFVHINVYPNALFEFDPGIGMFSAIGQDGRFVAGVSLTRALGLGFGGGTR